MSTKFTYYYVPLGDGSIANEEVDSAQPLDLQQWKSFSECKPGALET